MTGVLVCWTHCNTRSVSLRNKLGYLKRLSIGLRITEFLVIITVADNQHFQ